ncbi:PASTA domain-containing protein [Clavibacter sepedonicus]|nr:PASTA domain-containing protein [Clavibacter sepedonicus]OQJ52825.1 PASTA domain-containing protein [Clavibacter sepedonicus]
MTRTALTLPAAALLSALLLTGCSAADPISVPDVSGMTGTEAKNTLENAGFEVDLEADEGFVLDPANWEVVSQLPDAGDDAADGDTITLSVSKPEAEPVAEPTPAATPTEEAAPIAPAAPAVPAEPEALTSGMAMTVCDRMGKEQAPYGWDADFILDGTRMQQDGGWFLKAGVDITNAYDAEGRFTVECFVTGTEDSPTIETFNVY